MIEKVGKFLNNFINLSFMPHPHPWDYLLHFSVSFAGVFVVLFFLKLLSVSSKISFYSAIAIMLCIGVIKEIIDMRLGQTDMAGDLASDVLGIIVAIIIILFVAKITT